MTLVQPTDWLRRERAHSLARRDGLHLGLVPRVAADLKPAAPVVLDHDLDVAPHIPRSTTVSAMADLVDDLAGRLIGLGIRRGDHAVVHKRANADIWALGSAISRAGAIPVLLSKALPPSTVLTLLNRLRNPAFLTDEDTYADFEADELGSRTSHVLLVTGSGPGVASIQNLSPAPLTGDGRRGPDDAALITHTSGTTGIPKLVVHTPRTMALRLTPQWILLQLVPRRETVAIAIPFAHSRTFAAISLALLRGSPTMLMARTQPEVVASTLAEHRPSLLEALPNALLEWETIAPAASRPFASVKYFSSTFDALHPRTMSLLLESSQRTGAVFFQIYGQSEVGPAVGRLHGRRSARRADGRCVGWVMPRGAQVRIVHDDGSAPSEEHPGHIEVAWPALAATYLGEQDRYDANRRGRWWRTGDIGFRSRFGCIHMLDRAVDVVPGVHSTLEVEDVVLGRLEDIAELVLIRDVGSVPVPVVCTRGDAPLDPDRWSNAVAGLPLMADPVHLPNDVMPRTGTLKVRRTELAARLRTGSIQTL